MNSAELCQSLLAAGQAGDYAAVLTLPGAGVHAEVLRFADSIRGTLLGEVVRKSPADQAAFAKALAVYENTVNGLGSVTALQRVLPVIEDEGHVVLDWVLSHTRSYWYYSDGAKSFAELQVIRTAHAVRRAENVQREREREATARTRRAEIATANLYKAIRRGDARAVDALLRQGALPSGVTPDGIPYVEYALSCGYSDIAAILRR